MNLSQRITLVPFFAVALSFTMACSRENKVYSDPEISGALAPVATTPTNLPEDFYNQSVNRASVDVQPESVSSSARALRFQTETGSNPAGAFNGPGTGSTAILGLGAWSSRPVIQAEPITFDAKNYVGSMKISLSLQLDLACDGTDIRVVHARGTDIEDQSATTLDDGYQRFSASVSAPIWLSRSDAILDPATSETLLADSGAPTSLQSVLAKFPAACLKTASTAVPELPLGIPTAPLLWSLGDDSTDTANVVFVRRLTVGSEIYETLR